MRNNGKAAKRLCLRASKLKRENRDIKIRLKQAINELRKSEQLRATFRDDDLDRARFRSLVETTADWIWEIDEDFVYVYSSPKVRDLLGYEPEEVVGKTPCDFMNPEDAQRFSEGFQAIKAGLIPFFRIESVCVHKNGAHVIIEKTGVPVVDASGRLCGYRGIDRDVTEMKKLEQKFLQAQKMEAVGRLAGSIAHDFNNIITAIIGFEQLLSDRLDDEKARHYNKQVLRLAGTAANLTQSLLNFSRKQTKCPKLLDINETIRNAGDLMRGLIGENIEYRDMLCGGHLPVKADTSQIEQVLMNLVTNARDAMPNGGSLTVHTEIADIDRNFVTAHGYGRPGKYALVSVSDTGTGMDEETRKRVFEPFFTTKEIGKGTGLGLSTVWGIIKQSNGYIDVYSEIGEGTTFRIYLPLMDVGKRRENDYRVAASRTQGNETVLLADDEPDALESRKRLLEKNGYKVIGAEDGNKALEEFVAHELDIDVLISDVFMPRRNGGEVYETIRKARPDIKTIFVSGYATDTVHRKGIPDSCFVMTKPLSPHAFLTALRNTLDGSS